VADARLACGIARPVVAGFVLAGRIGATFGRRSCQDIVLVRSVARPLDLLARFAERENLAEDDACARLLDGVAVDGGDALTDQLTALVVPGTGPDAVAGVHRTLALECASAPARPPRFAPSPLPTLVMKKVMGAAGAGAAWAMKVAASSPAAPTPAMV